jgi:transglycosylase-like protein with SLT domain
MWRSIPFIVAALQEAGVRNHDVAERYATVIQEEAIERNFDPITMVALFEGEAGFNPSVVNASGCVGLGQICVQAKYEYCRPGALFDEARCNAKIGQLKDPVYNIRTAAAAFEKNREFCNKMTNKRTAKTRSQLRHWLPSYGGYNDRRRGIWCGQRKVKGRWKNVRLPKRVAQYMVRRKQLIRAAQNRLARFDTM